MRMLAALLGFAILVSPAFSADEPQKKPKATTAQQQKMKTCNAEAKAKGLKGGEYMKYRNDCLRKKS